MSIPTASIRDLVHTVEGSQYGMAISLRGPNDEHLVCTLLVEDDENWFVSDSGVSSFWLPDLEYVMNQTKLWLDRNAIKGQWGWELKKGND